MSSHHNSLSQAMNIDVKDEGIIGYDCTNPTTNITVVSINSVDQCNSNHKDVRETEEYVTIIQELNIKPLIVTTCKVTRSMIVYHCGMHSHSTISRHGFITEEILSLSKSECYDLYNHGTYKLGNGFTLTKLPRNTLRHRQVVEAGSMSNDHHCEGANFNHGESTWDSVVVQASYTFFTTKVEANLISDKGKIQMSSGYLYDYLLSESFDSTYGSIFWETTDDMKSCNSCMKV